MFDSPIIDVAIGLFFLFAVLATLSSAVTEAISRFLGLRGAYLLTGLRALVDGTPDPPKDSGQTKPAAKTPFIPKYDKKFKAPESAVISPQGGTAAKPADPRPTIIPGTLERLLATPALSSQGALRWAHQAAPTPRKGKMPKRKTLSLQQKRDLPSYISSRTIAAGVLDLLVPNTAGQTTMTEITAAIGNLSDGVLKQQLLNLAKAATGGVNDFRTSIEMWYDDHMDRVSGWYKRYTRWITIVAGAIIVIAMNIQLFAFAQSLYTDQALSKAVVTKAVAGTPCQGNDPGTCIEQARQEIQSLDPALSLGWSVVADCRTITQAGKNTTTSVSPDCSNIWQRHGFAAPTGSTDHHSLPLWFTVIVGWLLTILALIPGSRFWFDLVNQFGSLRSAGPKPTSSTKKSR